MVTSNDWHSLSSHKNQDQNLAQGKLDGQKQNSKILRSFVESSLSAHKGRINGSKIPFLIFEELKSSKNILEKIDLTVYPASSRSYQKYIIYNHIEAWLPPFSFTLIVFAPKQKTPKHSHRVDCAPLCLKGLVQETLYQETEQTKDDPNPCLEKIRSQIYKPYEGAYLHKCQPNIHHLENTSDAISMSLHLYLFDACCPTGKSTSILKVYR
ncbi:MAG: hypothetical protein AB8G05_13210 [Oligoflexales bacterium]